MEQTGDKVYKNVCAVSQKVVNGAESGFAAMPAMENGSQLFAALANPVYTRQGDAVTANRAVQRLDPRTGLTQASQFGLALKKTEGNRKKSCRI